MWRGIDKRRFPRASCSCFVTLHRPKSKVILATQTENIGVGGVCVVLDKKLDVFSEVELELSLRRGIPPIKCKGSVIWVVKRTTSDKEKPPKFDTGIEFLNISEEERVRIESIMEEILEKEKSA